jgi:hypothetical protein
MKSEYPILPNDPTQDDIAEWCRAATRLRQEEDLGDYTNLENGIDTYEPADSSIGLDKLEDGTANRLVGYNDSGVPSEIGVSGATLSGTTLTVSSGSNPINNNGYRSGDTIFGNFWIYQGASRTASANRLYAMPFMLNADTTLDRIGCSIQSGHASNARLGIYNWENGVPTSLVLDAGEVSVSTSGDKLITINQSLDAGIYVLAVVFAGTPNFEQQDYSGTTFGNGGVTSASLHNMIFGNSSTNVNRIGCYTAHTYGVLPDPFGSPTWVDYYPIMFGRAA